jgi:hypothetical protein
MNEVQKYLNNVSYADTGDDLETIETVTVSEALYAANLAKLDLLDEIVNATKDEEIYDTINRLTLKYKKLI